MVKKLLSFINREINGLHEAAYLLGVFALFSQVLALFRDRLLANYFGATSSLDVYYAAFRVPDLIFASVASLVSISVLIPFLVERLDKSKEEGREFISEVFTIFLFVILVVVALAFVLMPELMSWFFPTLSAGHPELVTMARIMLLSPLFLGFSNFFASITQVYNRFFIYAISPLLYNLGIIIGIVFLRPIFGLVGLAYGVAIGAVMHAAIQLPFVIKQGMFPVLKLKIAFSSVRRVVLLSLPRTITASSNEIAEFFLIAIASTLAFGSVSVFNLSFNLQSVSLSIIGVSYSLAAFPVLTRHFTSGRRAEFIAQMIDSARHIIFWSVPLSILFIVLRAQIVRTILGSGHFNWSDTRLTAAALAIFSVSLVCQNLLLLFVRSYYSRGHTKRPLVINAISAILMVVLGYGLSIYFTSHGMFANFIEGLLRVSDLPGTVALMLPLAFSIGVIVNLVIHWIDFSKEYREFSSPVLTVLYQTFAAAVIMGGAAYQLLSVFARIFDLNTVFGVFMQGFCAGLGGIVIYVIILRLLKSRELGEVWRTLHHKIWKTKLVSLEQPELS